MKGLRARLDLKTGIALGLCCCVAGCGWNDDRGFIVDRSDDYIDAKEYHRLVVPEDLSSAEIRDQLVIPEIPPQQRKQLFPHEAPRPNAIYAKDRSQGLKIQKLEEDRWLVVPQSPNVAWPKVKQFLADNGIRNQIEVPQNGFMETEWLTIDDSETYRDVVRLTIRDAKQQAAFVGGRDRLVVRVEQGIRERSSEIHIRHQNDADGVPLDGRFPAHSAVPLVADEVLGELGTYIAAHLTDEAVSYVARNISTQTKARLDRDESGQPILYLNLGYDRAWATVNQALGTSDFEVRDVNRANGEFVVIVTESDLLAEERGWFGGMILGEGDEYDVTVKLSAIENGYIVSVRTNDENVIPEDVTQQVLVAIKELAL